MKNKYLKSPLNYVGGKYKLLPQILPLFPNNIDTFVDLFCGGCNVGINVDSERYIFNDLLTPIIEMYKVFKENGGVEYVLEHIKDRIEQYNLSLTNVDGYNKLREEYNVTHNPLDLFVLVAYSFNHQIRFNQSGGFNMPFGKERSHFNPTMEKNLVGFINKLSEFGENAIFLNKRYDEIDFESIGLTDKSFIYVDPPYLITNATYNEKVGYVTWNYEEEKRLLSLLEGINTKGYKFALSNVIEHKGQENTLLKEWIERNKFSVHYLNMDYSNSNYQKHGEGKTKSKSIEVLVTNYTFN